MATSLSASVLINIAASYTNGLDLSTVTDSLANNNTFSYTDGTGAAQAQVIFSDTRTLSSSSNEELDLYGSLTDAFGNTVDFAAVKVIIVKSASTNGDTLTIGGSAANGFDTWVTATGDSVTLNPGGMFVLVDPGATGYAVTDATGDLFKITNNDSGASADYDVILIGE